MPAPDVIRLPLKPGETAVVGYGSLLSRASMERTLGRPYHGYFGPCHVEGWRRSWDAGMPNRSHYFVDEGCRVYPEKILYLNVRPVAGAVLNAVMFVVDGAELEAMHRREWIYEPRIVTATLRDVVVEGGDAVMYVTTPDCVVADARDRAHAAVRASYLRIVQDGLDAMNEAFRAEYLRTTDPVPEALVVDDRLDADRPVEPSTLLPRLPGPVRPSPPR